jgi:hypothetical protein
MDPPAKDRLTDREAAGDFDIKFYLVANHREFFDYII